MKYKFNTYSKDSLNIIGLRKKEKLIYLGYYNEDINNFQKLILITKLDHCHITKNIHERHLSILIYNS